MLVVENVSHGFGARTILENVSFRLRKGEHIALVGANGEGKSTFLNIITKKQEHFSKKTLNLHTKSEYENMLYGRRVHEKFEYDGDMEKNLLQKYFNQERVKKTYHEFEFMYEEDNIKYHGIIDLILEFENKIIIIDYKLKNIQDEKYLLQLEGYKKYLKMISNKKIEIYLYSIKEEKLQKIE